MSLPAKQGSFQQPRFLSQNYDLPEDFLCVRVIIPNSLPHKRLLASLVNIPTQAFTWQSETDEERQALAQLWQRAYTENDWGDGCVDCAAIIECIENDDDVKAALAAWFVAEMAAGGSVRDAVYATAQQAALDAGRYPYGENLPDSALTFDMANGYNPTCDPDIVWAQCLALVQETNRAIVDILQAAEAASNAGEFAQWIADLPLLNLATRNSGLQSALEVGEKFLNFVTEGYEAQYTTAVENEIACQIFCACRDDCVISIERIYQVMYDRLSVYITPPVLGNLADWIGWFGTVVLTEPTLVDIAFFAAYGSLKVANFLFGEAANYLLDTVVAVSADDPSDDWMIYCDVCNWTYTINLTEDLGDWTINVGTFTATVGVTNTGTGGTPYTVDISINVASWGASTLTNWRVNAVSSAADSGAFRGAYFFVGATPTYQDVGGDETGSYELAEDAAVAQPDSIHLQISNASVPGSNTMLSVTLSGTGDMPIWS